MSDTDFLKAVKNNLIKAVISIVVTFIGAVVFTVFTVKGQTQEINELQKSKADKEMVEQQMENINIQMQNINYNVTDIKDELREGQKILIDLLRE